MVECPTCKGKGTQQITCQDHGSKVVEQYTIPCLDCGGKKVLTESQYRTWQRMQAYAQREKDHARRQR